MTIIDRDDRDDHGLRLVGTCSRCGGEGKIGWGFYREDGSPTNWFPCLDCDGTGELMVEDAPVEPDDDYFEEPVA